MMESTKTDTAKRKRRLKIMLWILFPVFVCIPVSVGVITDSFPFYSLVSLILGIVSLIVIIFISENYYNWPLVLFILFFTGLFFKRQHWPLAGTILTISTFILTVVSVVIIFRFLFISRQNKFIRWFGISTGLITVTFMSGWVIILQHWDYDLGTFLGYTGCILMIITVLAMVFTLSNSNYIDWSPGERKTFFRVVLLPMVFLIFIMTFNLVFPEAYATFMNFDSIRWSLDGIELLKLEGVPEL
jgi:hypothetical protein